MADTPRYANVVDPTTGKMHHVRAEDVQAAQADGLRLATAQEVAQHAAQAKYGGPTGMAASAAIGIGQAATLGFGAGVVADVADAVDPDAGKAVREYVEGVSAANPNIRTGTEIAGTIGLALASGGGAAAARGGATAARGGAALRTLSAPTRALMRTGAAAERGLGGGLMGATARAAVEGAAYEAGNAYSEAALGDEQLTGERLAAAMGHGAMLGGGMGLALAGAARGLEKGMDASKRLMSRALARPDPASVERVVEKVHGHAPKGIGQQVADRLWLTPAELISGAPRESLERMTRLGREGKQARVQGIHGKAQLDDHVRALDADLRAHADTVSDIMNEVSGVEKAANVSKIVKRGNEAAQLAQGRAMLAQARAQLDEAIAVGKVRFGKPNALKDLRARVDQAISELERIAASGDDVAGRVYAELDNVKKQFYVDAESMRSGGSLGKERYVNQRSAALLDDIYRGSLLPGLEDVSVWGEAGAAQKAINTLWAHKINNGFSKHFAAMEKGYLGTKRMVVRDGSVDRYVRNLLAPKNDQAHAALLREFGDSVELMETVGRFYDLPPEKVRAIKEAAERAKRMRTTVKNAEELVTNVNHMSAIDASDRQGSMVGGMLGGAIGAGSPMGALAAGTVGLFSSPGKTVRQLAALERMAGSIDAKIAGSVKGLFRKATRGAIVHGHRPLHAADREQRRRMDARKEYEQRAASVREYALNRPALETKLSQSVAPIADTAPMAANSAIATALRAQDYLQTHLPTNDLPSTMFGHAPRTSKMEAEKWLRRARAIDDPTTVLDDLGKGKLSRDAVHAIKNVYPAIYADMQQQVMDEVLDMREMGKQLPYRDRMQLGILFEVPVDPTLSPRLIEFMQQSYQQDGSGAEQQAAGAKVAEDPDVSDVYQSASERTEKGSNQ